MKYYEILQVTQDASPEVIRMAYRALAKKYHPDLYSGDKEYAKQKMQQINEAYSVLSSPALRSEYDQKLKNQTQTNTAQYNYSRTTQAQNTYTPPKPPSNEGEGDWIKKLFSRIAEGAVFLWETKKGTLAIILLVCIALLRSCIDNTAKPSPVTTTKPSVVTTMKPSYPVSTPILPKVAEPASGTILSGYEQSNGSEITITTSGGHSCVVKLKTKSGTTRLSFYVRAGDTVTVGVPAEYLYVYFASGKEWYGQEHLFGESTSYSMDDDLCDFTQYSWEYTLQPVVNGNFCETIIDEEDFK